MSTSENRPDSRGEHADQALDDALKRLGAPCEPSEICPELEANLDSLKPVRIRRRGFDFALVGAICLLYLAAMLLFMDLRADLDGLPVGWFIVYSGAWLVSFVAIAYLALVPRRGQVMANNRLAGKAAVAASFGFVAGGLLFDRQAPGESVVVEGSVDGIVSHGLGCLSVGSISALVPVLLGALLLRNRLPVGQHWAGAGLGAAGGSLGGLLLHLHCDIADAVHLGIVHGGVVTLGALLGAVLLPRAAS